MLQDEEIKELVVHYRSLDSNTSRTTVEALQELLKLREQVRKYAE